MVHSMTNADYGSSASGRRLMASSEYKHRSGNISEMTRWRREKAGIEPKSVLVNGRRYYFEDEVLQYLDHLAARTTDKQDVIEKILSEVKSSPELQHIEGELRTWFEQRAAASAAGGAGVRL